MLSKKNPDPDPEYFFPDPKLINPDSWQFMSGSAVIMTEFAASEVDEMVRSIYSLNKPLDSGTEDRQEN